MELVCPHCGVTFSRVQDVDRHAASCLSDPLVGAFVKAGLWEASPLGVLLAFKEYVVLRMQERFAGMPSAEFLRWSCGGSWDGVAQWAGLRDHGSYLAVALEKSREFVAELSGRLHGGNIGCSQLEYDAFRPDYLLVSQRLFRERTQWRQVLWWADRSLREETPEYYMQMAQQRMEQMVAERNRCLSARKRLREVEEHLEAQERFGGGLEGTSSRVAILYDWNRRGYYEQTVTSIR